MPRRPARSAAAPSACVAASRASSASRRTRASSVSSFSSVSRSIRAGLCGQRLLRLVADPSELRLARLARLRFDGGPGLASGGIEAFQSGAFRVRQREPRLFRLSPDARQLRFELLVRLAPHACDLGLERMRCSVRAAPLGLELRFLPGGEGLLAFTPHALDFLGEPRVGLGAHARDFLLERSRGRVFGRPARTLHIGVPHRIGAHLEAFELRHACALGLVARSRQLLFQRLRRFATDLLELRLQRRARVSRRRRARLQDGRLAQRVGLAPHARQLGLALGFRVGLRACDRRLEIRFRPHAEQLDLRLVDGRMHRCLLRTGCPEVRAESLPRPGPERRLFRVRALGPLVTVWLGQRTCRSIAGSRDRKKSFNE